MSFYFNGSLLWLAGAISSDGSSWCDEWCGSGSVRIRTSLLDLVQTITVKYLDLFLLFRRAPYTNTTSNNMIGRRQHQRQRCTGAIQRAYESRTVGYGYICISGMAGSATLDVT